MEQGELFAAPADRPPKRGARAVCQSCGRIRPHYARNLCRSCYHLEWRLRDPDEYHRRIAEQTARAQDQKQEAARGWKRGSWRDPAVRAHHRAMIKTYFGEQALSDWGLSP